jgi:hypothetical protein
MVEAIVNPCTFDNPANGNKCRFEMFHEGPHRGQTGEPGDWWVTPCISPPCEFHRVEDPSGNVWEECVFCYRQREVRDHDRPLPSVKRARRFTFFKGHGIRCLTIVITTNKSMEIQVGRFSPAPYFFTAHLGWNRHCDHGGPEAEIGIWGFHLITKIYDVRHWDHEAEKWENVENEASE